MPRRYLIAQMVPPVWCAAWFKRDERGNIVSTEHCALRTQPTVGEPRYRDHLATACRQVITLPGTIAKRVPTCRDCIVRLVAAVQVHRIERMEALDAMLARMKAPPKGPAWKTRACSRCFVGPGMRCRGADGRALRCSHRERSR